MFSDSQTSLVLSALWTRCSAGHLTPALAAAMCTTFQARPRTTNQAQHCRAASPSLSPALCLLGKTAPGEGRQCGSRVRLCARASAESAPGVTVSRNELRNCANHAHTLFSTKDPLCAFVCVYTTACLRSTTGAAG